MTSHPDFVEASRRVSIQTPVLSWPPYIRNAYFSPQPISFQQRMSMVCFFYGNGCSPQDIVTILRPKLRDRSAIQHVDSVIASVASESYDAKWFYYNVHLNDYMYLNGNLCSTRQSDARIFNLWDSYCDESRRLRGRYPTLKEEEDFFSGGASAMIVLD